MKRSRRYKKYDPSVRFAIALTGNAKLFPELKIARSTANSWAKAGLVEMDLSHQPLVTALSESKAEISRLQYQTAERTALILLLRDLVKILGFDLARKQVTSPEVKNQILDSIEAAMLGASREACLKAVGLSLSRYKRWRRDRRGCALEELRSCPRRNANQLNFSEIQTMRSLVTSSEYGHFPIRSLHFFAKREGLLFCSYSTWRRYIERFNWKRPRKMFRAKRRRIGIRAAHPNEIWHLDVSYFVLPNKTKCFIQAVVDNYSRFVIAWQTHESFDGAKTHLLLKEAIARTQNSQKANTRQRELIVDGGGENRSREVRALEEEGHFKKRVARFEISFSNSIVETVFRSLKNNYLYHQEITSFSSFKRHVDFWFREHNERIPHASFSGETPKEKYNLTWNQTEELKIIVAQKTAIDLRIKQNQKLSCSICKD